MDSKPAFVREVLGLFDKADSHSELFWRVEGDDVQMYANVSDVFAWGTADLEEITPDRLPVLQQAYDDLIALDSAAEMVVLYAARVRGQRPQGAAYPDHPTVRALLDECGPERPVGLCNPMTPAALDRLDADLEVIAEEMAAVGGEPAPEGEHPASSAVQQARKGLADALEAWGLEHEYNLDRARRKGYTHNQAAAEAYGDAIKRVSEVLAILAQGE